MAEEIEFVRNVSDLCTDKGFQFEFHCDRCGGGFRTHFQASATGTIASALDAAGGLLGGIFSQAASVSDRVHSAAWERLHDKHYEEAVDEVKPHFVQCPHCLGWVCRKQCWNDERGLCKNCAPDLAVEMAAAQSERTIEEIHAHARVAEEDKPSQQDWSERVQASCPKCGAALPKQTRFCPECGAKLGAHEVCAGCGAKLQPGARFCGECGQKVED